MNTEKKNVMEFNTGTVIELISVTVIGLALMVLWSGPTVQSLPYDSFFAILTAYHVCTHVHAIVGQPFPLWSGVSKYHFSVVALMDVVNFFYLGFVKNLVLAQGMVVAHLYFLFLVFFFPERYRVLHDFTQPDLYSGSESRFIRYIKKFFTSLELGAMLQGLIFAYLFKEVWPFFLAGVVIYFIFWVALNQKTFQFART